MKLLCLLCLWQEIGGPKASFNKQTETNENQKWAKGQKRK